RQGPQSEGGICRSERAARRSAPYQLMAKRAKPADARASALRALPSIDESIRAASARESLARFSPTYLKALIARAQSHLREEILAGKIAADREAIARALIDRVEAAAANDESAMKAVVNATGVVLHTNLGRAILPEAAIEAIGLAARSAMNLEF